METANGNCKWKLQMESGREHVICTGQVMCVRACVRVRVRVRARVCLGEGGCLFNLLAVEVGKGLLAGVVVPQRETKRASGAHRELEECVWHRRSANHQ
jgi:hypothetical protein